MLDAVLLRELLDYDPATGLFTWRVRDRRHFRSSNQWKNWNSRYPGTAAGRISPRGYRHIAVFDKLYRACRLAWLYHHGAWPIGQIDHANGDRADDSIINLRDVTPSGNARNLCREGWSGSGRVGVTPYRRKSGDQCWVARIRVNGSLKHLGYFGTIEEAAAARRAAEVEHGFTTWPKSKAPIKSRGFSPTRSFNPHTGEVYDDAVTSER